MPVASESEATLEATVDTSSSKSPTASTLAQSVPLCRVKYCLAFSDELVDAHCATCKATGTRCARTAAPT